MLQETLILKLAKYYLEERKASAITSVKRTVFKWGVLYFALLFFFVAFIGLCLSGYLWLEPQLGSLKACAWITALIAGLGLFCVLIAYCIGRSQKSQALSPEMVELCTQFCKEIDLDEMMSKHGLKVLVALFALGFLSSKCSKK